MPNISTVSITITCVALEPLSSKLDAFQLYSSKLHTYCIRRAESDDDMYWSRPLFWPNGMVHAAHTASMTAPRPISVSVTPLKPATFPYLKSDLLAAYPVVGGTHGTPIVAQNQSLPPVPVSVTNHVYPAFNAIVPPGPCTEQWIDENRWHLQWSNTFCEVAEMYGKGKWVHTLVTQYEIAVETAETNVACIMYDYDV